MNVLIGMTRTNARPRKQVSGLMMMLLRPFFRYSITRDAYVLRIIGNRVGPVLQRRMAAAEAEAVPDAGSDQS